eukprot:scaffold25518_cov74-Phaeocystis_antarctica.AAC.7
MLNAVWQLTPCTSRAWTRRQTATRASAYPTRLTATSRASLGWRCKPSLLGRATRGDTTSSTRLGRPSGVKPHR